ncbi:hypothetical protein HDV03_002408 [Kappamyces sp. JEL0829]|nr:hypothetical protein HDV03_002408 [Kappamyces sp. JEL0829]
MAPKPKKFIDPRASITFKLVHRSQRDARIADENASAYVLQPMPPSINLQKKGFQPDLDFNLQDSSEDDSGSYEDESDTELHGDKSEDERPSGKELVGTAQDPSNFGVYFNDDYNYLQHMKTVGEDPSAVMLSAPSKTEDKTQTGIKFIDEGDKVALDAVLGKKNAGVAIPLDVFGSKNELEVGLMNQEGAEGITLDMDPNVRDAFDALEDEAYVEDLEEDFFDAFHAPEVPDKWSSLPTDEEYYANLRKQHGIEQNEEEEGSWLSEFKKQGCLDLTRQFAASDDDASEEIDDFASQMSLPKKGPKSRKAPSTAFSMTSSSMFRNEKLELLDDQFDHVLAEYSDDEIGELDGDDEQVLGEADACDPALDEIYDGFLKNLKVFGQRKTLVSRDPKENLDAIRAELREEAKSLVENYKYEEEYVEREFRMPEPKKKAEWDVETVLSTNSNIYNRPKLIHEISKGAPKIRLSKGIPKVIPEQTENEVISDQGSDHTATPAVNKGKARSAKESSEEKKARKAAVKEERRERRQTKKATKEAFSQEKGKQYKQLPNIKLQAHSDYSINIEFNEDDLNDPSLLAELAGLTMDETTGVAKKPAPKPLQKRLENGTGVDIEAILAAVPLAGEDDVVVELTDNDLNDPTLLAELAAVEPVAARPDPTQGAGGQPEPPTAAIQLSATLVSQTTVAEESTLESKLRSTNIHSLQQYVQVEKVKALNKKRAGDKQGALESLRSAKELEKRIAELSQLETEKETPAVQAGAREHGLDEEGASSPNTPAAAPRPARTEEPKPLGVPAPTSDLMEQRSKEYKRAALRYKKEGNLEMAREMLSTAKAIEKAAVDARHGLAQDDYVLPPEPSEPKLAPETAVEPAATPVSVAITAATVQTSTKDTTSQLVQHLLDTLDSQITLCTKLSAQYFTANQKDLALDFHKRKKTMTQMKQTLSTMKHLPLDPQNLPFQFSYTTLEYTIAQSHPDVALDQMEVAIIKGMDMSAAGDASIETGVWFDMGWPFNASGTLPEGKGGTATLKGLHPEYQLKQTIKIERTKAFQRFLERRKATFEAYAVTKSLFGIMSTKTPLGKAVVKLDDLLSKCEIHQLMEPTNPRKATGAALEIHIRMRAPLIKADIVKTSEKWLEVAFGDTPQALREPAASVAAPVPRSPVVDKKSPIKKDRPQTSGAATTTAGPSNPNPVAAEDPDLELAFLRHAAANSPDNIISNAVLEHEHQLVVKALSGQSQPSEELLDQKNGYEIRMNMLVTMIQLGKLNMPGMLCTAG